MCERRLKLFEASIGVRSNSELAKFGRPHAADPHYIRAIQCFKLQYVDVLASMVKPNMTYFTTESKVCPFTLSLTETTHPV